MSTVKTQMKLEKAARGAGGDKYVGELNGEPVSFYAPQSISRASGKPAAHIILTVERAGA